MNVTLYDTHVISLFVSGIEVPCLSDHLFCVRVWFCRSEYTVHENTSLRIRQCLSVGSSLHSPPYFRRSPSIRDLNSKPLGILNRSSSSSYCSWGLSSWLIVSVPPCTSYHSHKTFHTPTNRKVSYSRLYYPPSRTVVLPVQYSTEYTVSFGIVKSIRPFSFTVLIKIYNLFVATLPI